MNHSSASSVIMLIRKPITLCFTIGCMLPSQNRSRIAEEKTAEPNSIVHHSARTRIPIPLITKAIAAKIKRTLARVRVAESLRRWDKIHDLPVHPIYGPNSTNL